MSEWQECKLGDLTELVTKGTTPSVSNGGFSNSGVNFVKSESISYDGKIDKTKFAFISSETHEKFKRSQLKTNDILFSMAGVFLGKNALVTEEILPANTNQALAIIRLDNKKAISKFIHYFLRQSSVIELVNNMSGQSAQPNINFQEIKSIEIPLPPLTEQQSIANILSSLDDKIDLLHRQNKTLEQMAETLFRQWFIEEANEDWEEVTLEALVESANTGLDAIKRAPIVEHDTGIKCLRIQDISQKKKFENWGNSKVLEKDFEKAQLKTDDLIMARTCSPGIIYLVRENLNAVFNNGLARIRPNKNKTYSIFLFYLFKTEEFIGHIYGISDGTSVQLNMKLGDLLSYKVSFPPKELQDKYYPHFKAIEHKVFKNQIQINTLEKLRDNLLPKLMSGEVRVRLTEQYHVK